jgi:hypothetical protein
MADLTITAASVVAGANAETKRVNLATTVTAGKAVYLDSSDGKYHLADANSGTSDARNASGICLTGGANGQPGIIQTKGEITIGATMTAGLAYFLSNTGGGICPYADLTTGDYVCFLGIAKSTTVLILDPIFTGVVL